MFASFKILNSSAMRVNDNLCYPVRAIACFEFNNSSGIFILKYFNEKCFEDYLISYAISCLTE